MGGLSKVMPHTTKLMWVGTIALIGFFPLSKDEILAGAMEPGRPPPGSSGRAG